MNVAPGAMSFTGVLQDAPFGTPFSFGGLSSNLNIPVASPTYAALVDVLSHSTPYDWTPAAPQTLLWTEGNSEWLAVGFWRAGAYDGAR